MLKYIRALSGLTIEQDGADHAGGVLVNGYAHNLEIGNNRILNNSGVYGGGIRLGHPTLTVELGQGVEYQNAHNDNVRIHHNHITQNSGLNGTGGGVGLCTGSDNYEISDNFVCGNFSLGGGGGIGHYGLSPNGLIYGNKILFNESFNQGRTVNGGGILIAGAPPLGGPGSLSPGAGSVTVKDNRIQGNAASAGDGGGICTSRINGQDVADSSNNPTQWYEVNLFNNMITNNLAALAGGGVAMFDTARMYIIHNTIAHNDSTATASEAFGPGNPNESVPQPAGIVSRAHSPELARAFGFDLVYRQTFSDPVLIDDIIWQNRSFYFSGDPSVPTYELLPSPGTYQDVGVLGTTGALMPRFSILSGGANPDFIQAYFNEAPGVTVPLPEPTTGLQPTIAFDEGGNFIRVRFGPLTLVGDYHIGIDSSAHNSGKNVVHIYPELATDYDGDPRPSGPNVDIGADEIP